MTHAKFEVVAKLLNNNVHPCNGLALAQGATAIRDLSSCRGLVLVLEARSDPSPITASWDTTDQKMERPAKGSARNEVGCGFMTNLCFSRISCW